MVSGFDHILEIAQNTQMIINGSRHFDIKKGRRII